MLFKAGKQDADSARRRWRSAAFDADPYLLPASIEMALDTFWHRLVGFVRYVTIYKDRVSVQDSSPPFGIWAWDAAITDYEGVALSVAYRGSNLEAPVILVELRHADADKCVIVHASFDGADSGARWRSWGAQLGLPLLVQDRHGEVRDVVDRLGRVNILPAQPHRGASPLTMRRPMSFGYTGRPRQWSDRVSSVSRPAGY